MEDVMTAPEAPPTIVRFRDVEAELSRQMKAIHGHGEAPIQRARMANLVIYCNSIEQANAIEAQLPEIVAIHPARVLLLLGDPGSTNQEVTAAVRVRPLRSRNSARAVCEQVTLHTCAACVDRLPFAVRALVIGDLPTNIWWAAPVPPPFAGPLLADMSEDVQQIMYDSIGWSDPARGVAATANWLEKVERPAPGGHWRVASDLNWRRLKYWRRLIGQALDPAAAPGAADSVSEVLLEHGPHAVVQAWELASWLTTRLGWQVQGGKVQSGSEMTWNFTSPRGNHRVRIHRLSEGLPEIRKLRIACTLDRKATALVLAVDSPQRLAQTVEGMDVAPRTMTLPMHTASELVGRQLSDRERDPVFREAMAVAQTMAQSLF
jgi:glucose-6-phosphate dehydrogenase assembly protein OpcA